MALVSDSQSFLLADLLPSQSFDFFEYGSSELLEFAKFHLQVDLETCRKFLQTGDPNLHLPPHIRKIRMPVKGFYDLLHRGWSIDKRENFIKKHCFGEKRPYVPQRGDRAEVQALGKFMVLNPNCVVRTVKLVTSPLLPYTCTTPDAVTYKNGKPLIIEIKSPDILTKLPFNKVHLDPLDECGQLRKRTNTYFQLQITMELAGIHDCELLYWSELEQKYLSITVNYDKSYVQRQICLMDIMYFEEILPLIYEETMYYTNNYNEY